MCDIIVTQWKAQWQQSCKGLAAPSENPLRHASRWCRNKRGGEKAAYLQKTMGISREMPSLPLPTLKWGLGRDASWLHPCPSLRYIACTWAPLPSHRMLNHHFKPQLSIYTTIILRLRPIQTYLCLYKHTWNYLYVNESGFRNLFTQIFHTHSWNE